MILTQELRRDVEDIHSPAPQPEDPGRSLDPASEEDPDIKVELIDGVFHQLSMDNALVAITADYPGLSPASQVIMTRVLTPLLRPCVFLTTIYNGVSQEVPSRREAEPAAADQQGSVRPRRRKMGAVRIKTSPQRYSSRPLFRENIPRRCINAHDFFRRKSARRTVSGEFANQASASQAPTPGPEGR